MLDDVFIVLYMYGSVVVMCLVVLVVVLGLSVVDVLCVLYDCIDVVFLLCLLLLVDVLFCNEIGKLVCDVLVVLVV